MDSPLFSSSTINGHAMVNIPDEDILWTDRPSHLTTIGMYLFCLIVFLAGIWLLDNAAWIAINIYYTRKFRRPKNKPLTPTHQPSLYSSATRLKMRSPFLAERVSRSPSISKASTVCSQRWNFSAFEPSTHCIYVLMISPNRRLPSVNAS